MKNIMKRIYSFMAASVAMITAASCVQELSNVAQPQEGTVVYKAIADGVDSKAVLGTSESGRPQSMWEKGDKITIHNGQKGYEFTTSIQDPSSSANFEYVGDDFSAENGVIAVYPAGDYDVDIEAGSVMVTIPTEQQTVEYSYDRNAVPAVAYSADNSLHFYNAGGLLKFTMNQNDVYKVRFYANESTVTGSYYAVCRSEMPDDEGFHINYIPDVPEYNIDYAELTAPEGETFRMGCTYYISAMPNTYPGFRIEFFGCDGSLIYEIKYDADVTLNRNSILNLGIVGYDGWTVSSDKMYVVGTYNDWRHDGNLYLFDVNGDKNIYEGIVDFNAYGKRGTEDFNEFKLTGGDWGVDEYSQDGVSENEASVIELVSGGGNNINAYQNYRFYHFMLNKKNRTLTKNYAFNSIGVIGDFCAWYQDIDMNYNPDTQKFWVDIDFASDGNLKFRMDHTWGEHLGYDNNMGYIVYNGNYDIPYTAGQYRVYLDINNLSAMTYEFSAEAYGTEENAGQWDPWADEPKPEPVNGWSLIGEFNEWNGDIVMTETEPGQWEIKNFPLEAGQQWKLRKDGSWDVNYGGPGDVEPYDITVGEIFDATWYGVNMAVSTSGVYDIYFSENDLTLLVLAKDAWTYGVNAYGNGGHTGSGASFNGPGVVDGNWWSVATGDQLIDQIAFSGGIAYGDEYSDAYMVFEGNTVTTYGPAGNKIRGGEWEVAMNDSESNGGRGDAGWELGKLTTSEPALLFPWKASGGGTPVTEFDIMYYDANNITLVYTAGQSSGSWAEITHWCFVRK